MLFLEECLNGMQESYWVSQAWNWVKSHINGTWEILRLPFVNSGATVFVSHAILRVLRLILVGLEDAWNTVDIYMCAHEQ